ncbi:hypothetical protein AB0K57_24810, partial [Streptomyces halstedii]|uniref:hypothetical protein n=1 Tax=Streptomyces halstedii TaxID=1944 RepID=UPI003476B7BF
WSVHRVPDPEAGRVVSPFARGTGTMEGSASGCVLTDPKPREVAMSSKRRRKKKARRKNAANHGRRPQS